MAKRKILKITPTLVTLNVIVLVLIAGFYAFRLVKYYLKENGNIGNETVLLVDEIKKHQSFVDLTKGLVYDEESGVYIYKGEVKDNYLLYSGMMFRLVGIDEEGNIKAVSEDNVSLIYPGFNDGFEKSYVNKWLNASDEDNSGIFENNLVNSGALLESTIYCMDTVDDTNNIECNDKSSDMVITLLSLYDYKQAGGKASYLNNGTTYHLGTLTSDNYNYYVTEEGEIGLNQKTSRAITIKPVITLSSEVELISGNGKKDNPFIIEEHEVTALEDVYVNNIIKIDDSKYKVVEVLDDKVKVVSLDTIKENGEDLKIAFGGSTSAYSSSNTVGKYLNNTFLNSLSIKDKVVDSDWYIQKLSMSDMDYSTVRKSKVSAKVGMLTIGDFYINEVNNVFTILRGMEADGIINVLNQNGILFGDTLSSKYSVRPAFCLDSSLKIKEGKGTMDSPYVLGE